MPAPQDRNQRGGVSVDLKRFVAVAALGLFAGLAAGAQDYPAKPIKIIVPFPPAGGTDILAREVAHKVASNTKWTIVVDNRPGAGGNIGVDAAAKSQPDGYTLVMGQTSNLAINPTLYKNLPYDPLKDLAPVALVGEGPVALVVRADSKYKTLGELVAAAKAKPGTVTMATPGNGTVAHLSGVRLMNASGAKFEHVPYKGAGAALPDLLGGNVDFFISSVPTLQSHVASGKLRALAVTSLKRSPVFPEVPTVAETYKGFEAVTWFGILAPAGTPPQIVAKLNAEINKALKDPAVKKAIETEGGQVLGGTPQQFSARIKAEIANWSALVKQSGATID
ncbi:MAG: Bug family tripartite tricarboxylate transporter substrate binding protein [Clostridia bacterium]